MQSTNKPEQNNAAHDPSFGSVLKELSTSVKDLVQSEVDLVKAEIKESSRNLGKHSAQAAIFGALLGISVLPILAFLVIGLGIILGDKYWLSSLIVGGVCALVGGIMTFSAYKKIKEQDLTLPYTRHSIEREKDTVIHKVEDIKDAAKRRSA